jgi:hypothetical protein
VKEINVRGHNMRLLAIVLALTLLFLAPNPALAYVGPGAGLELVPYFLALVGWVAAAFGSILLWPFFSLLRRWRRAKAEEEKTVASTDSPTQSVAKTASDDNAVKA